MPTYKLYYFNGRGRAEGIRILFKLAGVDFEDYRIAGHEEWAVFKANQEAPFGTVPILEVDGKKLCQSKAIYRYLAREFGYYAESNWDCADIDCVIDMMEDFHTPAVSALIMMKDGEEKQKAQAEYKKAATKILGHLEKKLKENNGGDGFFVGSKMTVADILWYCESDFLPAITGDKELLSAYPKLCALTNCVAQNDKITAWVESRPVTPL